jgi:hypothetical protein
LGAGIQSRKMEASSNRSSKQVRPTYSLVLHLASLIFFLHTGLALGIVGTIILTPFFLALFFHRCILLYSWICTVGSTKPSEEVGSASDGFEVGALIEARFGGGAEWFAGSVTEALTGGFYDILYNDGDSESGVAADMIRRKPTVISKMPPMGMKVLYRCMQLPPGGEICEVVRHTNHPLKVDLKRPDGELLYNVEYSELYHPPSDMLEKQAAVVNPIAQAFQNDDLPIAHVL